MALQIEVRQVQTNELFRNQLDLGDETWECDPKDEEESVDGYFEYMNQRAREDSSLSDEEASAIRFSSTHSTGAARLPGPWQDPAIAVSSRVKEWANILNTDDIIQSKSDEVIERCAPRREGGDETDNPDPMVAYNHVSQVFGQLFSRAEIRSG